MASRLAALNRALIIYLFIFSIFHFIYHEPVIFTDKTIEYTLDEFTVAFSAPKGNYSSGLPKRSKSTAMIPAGIKCALGLKLLRFALAANLLLLSNDVPLNPGPSAMDTSSNSSHYSIDTSSNSSFAFLMDDTFGSSVSSDQIGDLGEHGLPDDSSSYFDLNLGHNGIRMGLWNVNYLTDAKFDQVKLFLSGKSGLPQLDILFLNETFLKPVIPSTFYTVPGFSTFRRDRKTKCGGGVLAFINNSLCSKRRIDLENEDLEIVWFEVCPFKSKRSVIIGSIYRPPSYLKDNDAKLEANIEKVHLLNKETIILSDINIDFLRKRNYDKHRLVKSLRSMNFKQLTNEVTRPTSGTCLDHVYSNQPRRMVSVTLD